MHPTVSHTVCEGGDFQNSQSMLSKKRGRAQQAIISFPQREYGEVQELRRTGHEDVLQGRDATSLSCSP